MAAPPAPPAPPTAPRQLSTQLLRFVLVGGLAFVVAFSSYHALLALGLWVYLANALAFIVGTITAYLINRRWTFEGRGGRAEYASVMALYGITFAVQSGIHAVMLALLPPFHGVYTCAFVIAQGIATAINFIVQRAVIFRPRSVT